MLGRREWMDVADAAAAQEWGRKHSRMMAARRGVAPVSLLILAGLTGWGAWWVWNHLTAPSMPEVAAVDDGLPTAFWMVAVFVLLATVFTFRPRSTPTPAHLLIVRVVVAGLVWLGLSTYALVVLAS